MVSAMTNDAPFSHKARRGPASTAATSGSRLQLARLTAATLKTGLELLGIQVLEAM